MSMLRACPLSASRPSVVFCSSRASSSAGPQPEAEVEVPLGAEALEPLTGLGRDADLKRYTVQHTSTQRHIEQQSGHNAARRHTHQP